MKKFFILFAIFVLTAIFMLNGFTSLTSAFSGDYTFYGGDTYSSSVELHTNNPWERQLEKLKQSNIKGESVRFQGGAEDVENAVKKLRLEIKITQTLSGAEIIYGYTYRIRGYVIVDGEKINVQIARRGNTVTIGSPIILGSY